VNTRVGERSDGTHDLNKILGADEAYTWFVPLIVLFLLWNRRQELVALSKRVYFPALLILGCGILLHLLGYMIQQARLSVLGFILGLHGLTGLIWGPKWLLATLPPFALLGFCMPIGALGDVISFPLRMFATKVTALISQIILGIPVRQNGTQLFDPGGTYQYEVAAACGGIRSLTAILAFGVIYGYLRFDTAWRRLVLVLAGIPLAVVANVFRLTLIILAAEAFGQQAGDYVHESSWLSLAPYIPSIGGVLLLGWWISEERRAKPRPVVAGAPATPIKS
jgi:exosortase